MNWKVISSSTLILLTLSIATAIQSNLIWNPYASFVDEFSKSQPVPFPSLQLPQDNGDVQYPLPHIHFEMFHAEMIHAKVVSVEWALG